MYKLDYSSYKSRRNFNLPFIIAGLFFFLVVNFFTYEGFVRKLFMDSSVEATKIDGQCHDSKDGNTTSCMPKYYYTVDGKDYVCESIGIISKKFSEDERTVYYKSTNPKSCVTDYMAKIDILFVLFGLIPVVFIVIGIIGFIPGHKKLKKIKYLATNGKLIKDLPYKLENSGTTVNNYRLKRMVVNYTESDGFIRTLYSEPRYDSRTLAEEGVVDLLIDPADPSNYYIDFNIEKK